MSTPKTRSFVDFVGIFLFFFGHAIRNGTEARIKMTKRTVYLLVALAVLISICIICLLLTMRDHGLAGSGIYFVQRGGKL